MFLAHFRHFLDSFLKSEHFISCSEIVFEQAIKNHGKGKGAKKTIESVSMLIPPLPPFSYCERPRLFFSAPLLDYLGC